MSELGQYTPLKTIMGYVLDETDKSFGDADKIWILGVRGVAHITGQFAGLPKTVRLPVLGNKTVPYPADCNSWIKIGILDENGQVNTLKVNNALTTFRDNNPNRLEDLTPDINNSIGNLALVPYYSNFFWGGGSYQLFGYGGGLVTYGECRADDANRVIILDPNFRYDSIIVEYISAPEKDSDYQVLTCLQEAVIAFIKWKMKLGSRDEFYAACIEGRRCMPKKKFVLQTFQQIIRENNGMKLKA